MGKISTIPNLKARFDAMVFRRRFDSLLGEIMPDLGTIRSAALELKECARFKEVLGIVLTLGNALNGGTFRGGAAGFQLEALAKVSKDPKTCRFKLIDQMKETRTAKGSGCPTLLHYLAKVLVRTDARLVLFLEDMPSLEPAARRES
jgi:diaphanous 1